LFLFPLKQKSLQFEIQSFKRNTSCCLIAHSVRNKWIATSVASLLSRNDVIGFLSVIADLSAITLNNLFKTAHLGRLKFFVLQKR
jgi:hypothetical protein